MKKITVFISLLICCILLPGLIYLGLAIYYQDSFYYGTWINGIYCTGKTVSEVEQELADVFDYEELTIEGISPYGEMKQDTLRVEDILLSYDYGAVLQEYLKQQNPFHWFYRLVTGQQNIHLIPQMSLDEDKLEDWIRQASFYQSDEEIPADELVIVLSTEGYLLQEAKVEVLQVDRAKEVIIDGVKIGETRINLMEEGCYYRREDTSEMVQIRQLYEKIEEFQQLDLTYEIKDTTRTITPFEAASWIYCDEEGNFTLNENGRLKVDEQAVKVFIDGLAKEYNTWHNHHFTTHDGREITITRGNYGIQIAQNKETRYLLELLAEGTFGAVVRIPEYTRDVTYDNGHVIWETYIEIDIGKQKMFFFRDSQVLLETDVVTGCKVRGTGTPEMVCYVYNKAEDTILRGENYRSPVNYWIPVYGGIGIHDAAWRSSFGGEIYIRDGSHGCINTPLEKMEELYNLLEVGMPVVIHN